MGPLGLLKKLNLRKLSVAGLLAAFLATPLSQALAWESNGAPAPGQIRSEEHTSELQSPA